MVEEKIGELTKKQQEFLRIIELVKPVLLHIGTEISSGIVRTLTPSRPNPA
jgi:hypothetical protein